MRNKPAANATKALVLSKPGVAVGDGRVERSRAAALRTTQELLFERGFSGASVDEISRRSGIAKTTIYRHWPVRAELLRDACSTIGTPLDVPDSGSLQADLLALLTQLAHLLRSARWTSVLPSVIDAAERDPEIAGMHARLQQGYTVPFVSVIHRAMRRRELPEETDATTMVAALTGPLFYRRWFSREPLTNEFVRQVIWYVIR